REHVPLREAAVLEGIALVLGLLEVALGELAGVGDDQPAGLERGEVHLERGRVHRHQHIGCVAGGVDLGRAEVDLERRDAEQRALRRADLGREVRESGEVVAGERGRQRELSSGQLHAVAAVAREADDDRFGSLCLGRSFGRESCHGLVLLARAGAYLVPYGPRGRIPFLSRQLSFSVAQAMVRLEIPTTLAYRAAMSASEATKYRPCVGVMLVNAEGKAFVGKRIDNREGDWWQMPQGGVDDGEDLDEAMLRELKEEIGA